MMMIDQGRATPPGGFEALADEDAAFAAFWQRRWGHFPRLFDEAGLGALLSPADLDRLVVSGGLASPDLQIIESGRSRDVPRTFAIAPATDVDLLLAMFDRGCSFRVQHLENYVASVAEACRVLERLFGFPVRCNAYVAPPRSSGLVPHYDSSESFVVQLLGCKNWKLFDSYTNRKTLPLANDPFSAARHKPLGDAQSIILEQGDLLYLPRGAMHQAFTVGAPSIHLTFSILGLSWADAIAQLVMLAAQRTDALRVLLPLGSFAPAATDALAAQARSLAHDIDSTPLFAELLDGWRAQFARHKPSARAGALEQRWRTTKPGADAAAAAAPPPPPPPPRDPL